MLSTFMTVLAQAGPMRIPAYFPWVALGLLCVGGLGWLIAAVLGFARARAYGESPRWFAVSAICLLLYHVQWFVFAVYGLNEHNVENVVGVAAFFNLFVALGAICAVVGFMRMNDARGDGVSSPELD
ncbi:MAG: hypothetical protein QOJ70_171 [Acidobacteriota bacterium]|jgi:hypothetical protein|nr:hypothetical protein [Acidobacteriota bacterium]